MRRSMVALVGRFLLLFVVALAVLTTLWPHVGPVYSRSIGALARPLFWLVETSNVTVIDVQDAELWVYRIVGENRIAPFTWFDRYAFFAVVPLLALFVATPGLGWWRRLARLGIGVGGLVLAHVGYVVVSIELSYAAVGLTAIGSLSSRSLDVWQMIVRILWEAAPIAIWVALTFETWRQRLAPGDSAKGTAGTSSRWAQWSVALSILGWTKKEGTS